MPQLTYSKVNNAIITLTDTDDLTKGKHFKSRFIQPGLAGYPGQFGNALIKKENLDRFVHTLRNKPVTINHKDKITEEDKKGEVFNIWFNPEDGWYWCDGIITDDEAINLINNGWSVSCAYDFTKADNSGGTENNIPYDIEFLDGEFNHLALVDNPRYEGANIVFNSKVENEDKWITIKPNGEENKGRHLLIKEGETVGEALLRTYGDKNQQKLFDTSDYKQSKEDYKKENNKDEEEKQDELEKYIYKERSEKDKKADEKWHQKVEDLEDKAYKEFKTIYENYIHDNDMEGWGYITGSRFSKKVKEYNEKYQKAFKNLESDRFVSFEEFAKREHKVNNSFDTVLNAFAEVFAEYLGELRVENKNDEKWITIKPHGAESDDYKRLKLQAGETPKEGMKRVYGIDVDKKESKKEKYTYLTKEEIDSAADSAFEGANLGKQALQKAYKDVQTDTIIKKLDRLGKIEVKKVGLDKGQYVPSIFGTKDIIKADTEETFYHELGHSIDHRLGKLLDKNNPQFNWISNELTETNKEIIKRLNYKLPSDLENKFKELSNEVTAEFKNKYANNVAKESLKQARDKYKNFDSLPFQLKENIIREISEKIVSKNFKDIINNNKNYKKWSVLSDVYSALTMGRDDRNKFLGAHSQEYWEDAQFGLKSGKSQNINSEIFANYIEMRMGNFEEQLNYLKNNEPKLYKQLDLLYNKIAEEMGKL